MNPHSVPGSKVVFQHPYQGYPHDQRQVAGKLFIGHVYTVQRTEVIGSRTNVWLVEHPGVMFNSIHFEDYHA